jgi:hypothetical protein
MSLPEIKAAGVWRGEEICGDGGGRRRKKRVENPNGV